MSKDSLQDPYRKHGLDVEGQLDCFLSETDRLSRELVDKTKVLPSAGSKCPFREDLHYAKEEVARRLQPRLQTLYTYRSAVTQEIERCRGNRSILSAHGQAVHLNAVKSHYHRAESAEAAEENRAVGQHARIQETIARAERALAQAETRKFPGREPRKPVPFGTPSGLPASGLPGGIDAGSALPSKTERGADLDPGLDGLISLDVKDAGNRNPFTTGSAGQ